MTMLGYSIDHTTDTTDGPATAARLADHLLDGLRIAAALKAEHGDTYAPEYGHLYATLSIHLRGQGLAHGLITDAIAAALESGRPLSHVTAEMGGRLDGTAFITDDDARQVADAIAKHFDADPEYAPQVMHADWDGEAGRVIIWDHGLADWAYLVRHGGMSDYGPSIEFEPMPLPEGVRLEVVNPTAIRVLPNR